MSLTVSASRNLVIMKRRKHLWIYYYFEHGTPVLEGADFSDVSICTMKEGDRNRYSLHHTEAHTHTHTRTHARTHARTQVYIYIERGVMGVVVGEGSVYV